MPYIIIVYSTIMEERETELLRVVDVGEGMLLRAFPALFVLVSLGAWRMQQQNGSNLFG